MASRHLARSMAMQALYEWDFNNVDDTKIDEIITRVIDEFGPGFDDKNFVYDIVHKVLEKRKEIDAIIKHAAPEWPLAQIATIDRNVLRIGLSELLFGNYKDVPPKVAINEAIELAKTFGGENSGKFINGVLGTVYRELGEPGKDDGSKKYSPEELEKLPIERRAGAVVMRGDNVALVHDVFGYWTLPKGRITLDESDKDGALRAVMHELGLRDLEIEKKICENQYIAHDPETGPVRRRVVYFLARTSQEDLHLKESGGLVETRWFQKGETESLKMYDDIRKILNDI
ncbi:MAG: N utilization substance protein B-like protein [Parcubacteria group bacterium GW2011_GWA2_47_10b]|uniref:Transcription antitermination protein NusB n=1 Tax=Candidatus Ryanbacteria bacterium RIFCSPLOWO2_02_FULL_47_14 TaxID=1802129 RepID=A0A1G2H1U3_9BACT|nr:MAG: N utilization substance protein B-like protein [Parcubacteria group bacterium GW2011_GWA2_47_10b]KKU86257.1 MAG: N utilization substance protein B-like protein [Parcubacteria group bacterium GW2011_GWA1_47_9]OGZ56423.1 MAG: transcription antitermination factor NusB [Candidatus Ryanbacteria bacterium RIFCSPLOWO2_02_FULL_47_14]